MRADPEEQLGYETGALPTPSPTDPAIGKGDSSSRGGRVHFQRQANSGYLLSLGVAPHLLDQIEFWNIFGALGLLPREIRCASAQAAAVLPQLEILCARTINLLGAGPTK